MPATRKSHRQYIPQEIKEKVDKKAMEDRKKAETEKKKKA